MARQIRTQDEINAVATDFETFILPFDASLDLDSRTTYGTTDPTVDLSMVNVRHLKDYTQFRGRWVPTPRDGDDLMTTPNNPELPYVEHDVVFSATNNVLYRRANVTLSANPNPDSSMNTGHWVPIGIQLTVTGGVQDVDMTTNFGLNYSEDNGRGTLSFGGYSAGNGIEISSGGEIRAVNFALTEVYSYATATARNAVNDIEWHIGDTVIITGDTSPSEAPAGTRQGQGTYIYTGGNRGNDFTGTTDNRDWTLLALPGNVVTMVAGTPGPMVTTQNIVDAINADSFTGGQVLTEAQAARVASRYTGTGAPTTSTGSGTRQTGDVYVDTDNDNFYFFDGTDWQQANPAQLRDVGNVFITTDPDPGQHLIWQDNAGGQDADGNDIGGWVAHNAGTTTTISMNDLANVDDSAAMTGQVLKATVGTDAQGARTISWEPRDDEGITSFTRSPNLPANEGRAGNYPIPADGVVDVTHISQRLALRDIGDMDVSGANNGHIIQRRSSNPADPSSATEWVNAPLNGTDGISSQLNFNELGQTNIDADPTTHDLLAWSDGDDWVNRSAADVLSRVSIEALMDVNHIDDMPQETFTAANNADGTVAENVRFSSTINIIGPNTRITLIPDTQNQFETGTFSVGDMVYFSRVASLNAATGDPSILGPYRVQDIGGGLHTVIFFRGDAPGEVPQSTFDAIGTGTPDTGYFIYHTVRTTITGTNPNDLLVRNTSDVWENATPASMAAHATNGISLFDLNNVRENATDALSPGDVLSWNGVAWQNAGAARAQLATADLDDLRDVVYDDDVLTTIYPVAIAENSRDAAENVSFSVIEPITDRTTLRANSNGTENFESGTFRVGDQVYITELEPPLLDPTQANPPSPINGPFNVVDLDGNNPIFVTTATTPTPAGQIPVSLHNFVNGLTNVHYAYVTVNTTEVVRPADVLVRSADASQWVNETAAQMASNPNGGIRVEDLRNVEVATLAPGTSRDGRVLTFEDGQWIDRPAGEAQLSAASLNNLGDVEITGRMEPGDDQYTDSGRTVTVAALNVGSNPPTVDVDAGNRNNIVVGTRLAFADGGTVYVVTNLPDGSTAIDLRREDNGAITVSEITNRNIFFVTAPLVTVPPRDGELLVFRNNIGGNTAVDRWVNEPVALSSNILTDVDTSTIAPTMNDHLVFNGTDWVPHSATSGATSIDVGDLSDTAGYTRRDTYLNQGALETGPGETQPGSPRGDGTAIGNGQFVYTQTTASPANLNDGDVIYVTHDSGLTDSSGFSPEAFNGLSGAAQIAGPFTVQRVQNLGGGTPFRFLVTLTATDATAINDVTSTTSAPARIITDRGVTRPNGDQDDSSPLLMEWTYSNTVTGEGEWRYVDKDDTIDARVATWARVNDGTVIPDDKLRVGDTGVEDWALVSDGAQVQRDKLGNVGVFDWRQNEVWASGTFVVDNNILWRALRQVASSSTAPTEGNDWTRVDISYTFSGEQGVLTIDPNNTTTDVAVDLDVGVFSWDGRQAYTQNTFVSNAGHIYVRTGANIAAPAQGAPDNAAPSGTANDGWTELTTAATVTDVIYNGTSVLNGTVAEIEDNVPQHPDLPSGTTSQYVLQVAGADDPASDTATWVRLHEADSNLVWRPDADTNGVELRQYRQGNDLRNIISTEFTNFSPTTGAGMYLRLEFGVFTPAFRRDLEMRPMWDQPVTMITAGVTNPPGVDEFISAVRSIDFGNTGPNAALELANFTPGTINIAGQTRTTPQADDDWTQPFTLTTGNILDTSTSASGGNQEATILFTQTNADGTTSPSTHTPSGLYTIDWQGVSAGNPVATIPRTSYRFYESRGTVDIEQTLNGLFTAANGSMTWTGDTTLTGTAISETGTTSISETYNLATRVYKDNRTVAGTVTANVTATRPTTVVTGGATVTLNQGSSNTPSLGNPGFPAFYLTTTGLADPIAAYNSTQGTADTILTDSFATGDGMILQTDVTEPTLTSNNATTYDQTLPAGVHWFGVEGTTAPTIEAFVGGAFQSVVSGVRNQTVTFDNSTLTGSNVPSGWTAVTYTFRGVSLTSSTRIRVRR